MPSFSSNPHIARNRQILKDHPEIKRLFGVEWKTKYFAIAIILTQITIAYFLRNTNIWLVLLLAYFIGSLFNHAMNVLIHDACHNLVMKKPQHNMLFSIIMNLPLGIPTAISFKRYHLDHHRHLGVYKDDPDVPSPLEQKIFKSAFMKIVWLTLFPAIYSLRPFFVSPKKISKWEILNFVVQIIFDIAIVYLFGWYALIYLVASALFSMSLHPQTGQFITEHYQFDSKQPTYSYYGFFNKLLFNIGYHNEHHDFAVVPWSRLKKLKEMAPEYYDNLGSHKSWVKVLIDFIFNPKYGLQTHYTQQQSEDSATEAQTSEVTETAETAEAVS